MKTLVLLGLMVFFTSLNAQEFVYDSTFGKDGVFIDKNKNENSVGFKGFTTPNGSIIYFEVSFDKKMGKNSFNAVKINQNGEKIQSFGNGGKIRFDYVDDNYIPAFGLMDDDKFVVADPGYTNEILLKIYDFDGNQLKIVDYKPFEKGYSYFPTSILYIENHFFLGINYCETSNYDLAVKRDSVLISKIDIQGKPDSTFSDDGLISIGNIEYSINITDMKPLVKFPGLVFSYTFVPFDTENYETFTLLSELNYDGKIIDSFGKHGYLIVEEISNAYLNADTTNNIFLNNFENTIVVKLNPEGRLLTSYGSKGFAHDFEQIDKSYSTLFCFLNDGQLYMFGSTFENNKVKPVIFKLNESGCADTNFGNDGVTILSQEGVFYDGNIGTDQCIIGFGSNGFRDSGKDTDVMIIKLKPKFSAKSPKINQYNPETKNTYFGI